jgi:hypothetical protein
VFLVRAPIAIGLGLVARKAAERLTASTLGHVDGVPGDSRPEAKDLGVKLRYVLLAAAIEALAFAIAKTLADRGTEKAALALTGKSTTHHKG